MSDVQSNQQSNAVPPQAGDTPPTPAVPDVSTSQGNVPPAPTDDTAPDTQSTPSAPNDDQPVQRSEEVRSEDEADPSVASTRAETGESALQAGVPPLTETDHVQLLVRTYSWLQRQIDKIRGGRHTELDELVHVTTTIGDHLDRV